MPIKIFFGTPLPDLRKDSESQANFGLEQTFKISKNIQKDSLLAESFKATVKPTIILWAVPRPSS